MVMPKMEGAVGRRDSFAIYTFAHSILRVSPCILS